MKTAEQAAKFGIVGVLNTVIDCVILNVLVFFGFTAAFIILGQKFLVANIIALTYAVLIDQSPLIIKYIIATFTTLIYIGLYVYYKREGSRQ